MSTNEPGAQSPYDPPSRGNEPGGPTPAQPGQPQQGPGGSPQQPSPYATGGVPPSAYPAPQPGAPYQVYPKNSLGVWSLVLGILSWFVCPIIASIAAIVTGHMSRRAVREGLADNGGLGLAGIILGWASLILAVAAIIIIIVGVGAAVNDPSFQDLINDPSAWMDSNY